VAAATAPAEKEIQPVWLSGLNQKEKKNFLKSRHLLK